MLGLRIVNEETGRPATFVKSTLVRWPTHGFCGTSFLSAFLFHNPFISLAVLLYAVVDGAFIFHQDRCLHDLIAGTFVARNRRN
jgi:uncharacterized RDD family membrane protein YckC